MMSPVEAIEASQVHKEELRARLSASRPWECRPEWETKGEDSKGKGKTREGKGRGKYKGDKGGAQKDERDKERK